MIEFLTPEEVALALKKPVRWVSQRLCKGGLVGAVKLGGNSWRIPRDRLEKWIREGCPGFQKARQSGLWRRERREA